MKWAGGAPKACDTCDTPIDKVFYDARTSVSGAWGHLCPSCFTFGPGLGKLGPGFGQKYEKQADGSFEKTGG